MKKPRKKPLKFGVDWHGWAWITASGTYSHIRAHKLKPTPISRLGVSYGKGWVRVRITEVRS